MARVECRTRGGAALRTDLPPDARILAAFVRRTRHRNAARDDPARPQRARRHRPGRRSGRRHERTAQLQLRARRQVLRIRCARITHRHRPVLHPRHPRTATVPLTPAQPFRIRSPIALATHADQAPRSAHDTPLAQSPARGSASGRRSAGPPSPRSWPFRRGSGHRFPDLLRMRPANPAEAAKARAKHGRRRALLICRRDGAASWKVVAELRGEVLIGTGELWDMPYDFWHSNYRFSVSCAACDRTIVLDLPKLRSELCASHSEPLKLDVDLVGVSVPLTRPRSRSVAAPRDPVSGPDGHS